MNVLDRLVKEADESKLSHGKTKIVDYNNFVFQIESDGVLKKDVTFDLSENKVIYKKKTHIIGDTNPTIVKNGNCEIRLNIGDEEVTLYQMEQSELEIAKKVCIVLTRILGNEAIKSIYNKTKITNPILWISTRLDNNKIKYDFDTNILSVDTGTVKTKYVEFDLKKQKFNFKGYSYSFDDIASVSVIDYMFIRIVLKNRKEIEIYKVILNKRIKNEQKEAYILKYVECLNRILIEKKYTLPTEDDKLIYIDETMEDYQKWISSIEVLVTDVKLVNTSFFEVNDIVNKVIFRAVAKKNTTKGIQNLEQLNQLRLFDILLYSRDLKARMLSDKISVDEYWETKRDIFKIIQKRYRSFEQIGQTYLKQRIEFFEHNEKYMYCFKSKNIDLNYELNQKQMAKENIVNQLMENERSVWNKLEYNTKLK